MPTEARSRLIAVVLLAALAFSGVLSSCSDDAPPTLGGPEPSASTTLPAPPDVLDGVQRVLDRRGRAVRDHDRRAFVRTVVGDAAFRAQQSVYFDNLDQLPLEGFGYSVAPADLVRTGDSYWVVVSVRMQLRGFDDAPVLTRDRYLFRPVGDGRFKVASVTDAAWEQRNDVVAQPWDDEPITVEDAGNVLGIFDDASRADAARVMRAAADGLFDVAAEVPYDWSRSVVVYALGDPQFIDALEPPPGADPDQFDGLSFGIPVAPASTRIASTRVALAPDALRVDDIALGRLVRHELTHVALGDHDAGAPLWLSEGIAEYVSVQSMREARREVPSSALDAAAAGASDLPSDATFDDDPADHYALSWWVCEYIARQYGPSTLWQLLDAYADDEHRVLERLLAIDGTTLAASGAELMLRTYRPSTPTSTPSGTGSVTPSSSPESSGIG